MKTSEEPTQTPSVKRRSKFVDIVVFITLVIGTAFGIALAIGAYPMLRGMSMPGSGGSAQMIMVIIFGPMLLVGLALAIGCPIGIWLLRPSRRGQGDVSDTK